MSNETNVMRYEGKYVLTNEGSGLKLKLQAALDVVASGALYNPK